MTLIDKAEALAPCPFCGGEARKWQDPSHSAAWFIGCDDGDTDCFGSIHWAETEAEAIAAWNRRAALPARGVGEYTLAPHLQKIVDGAKAAPQWDIQADRLAPTDAAQAREAALLSDAASVIRDLMAAYSKPDERLCCNGHECGCQGATVQMQAEYYANEFLALIGEPRT